MDQRSRGGLAAVSNAMLVGLPTFGPLTAGSGLKRLSGYLDLHLCFNWVAFVTQLKKTPLLKSLSPQKLDWQFVCIDLQRRLLFIQ